MNDVGSSIALRDLALVSYINLAHRDDRRVHMEKILASCPCPTRRVDAIRLIEDPERRGLKMRRGFKGHRGVASIYLSHVKAIEQAAADCGDRPFAVLEDDVHIRSDFWSKTIDDLPPDWEVILVSPRFRARQPSDQDGERKRFQRVLTLDKADRLAGYRDDYFITGAHFVIYRNAAVALAIHQRLEATGIYDVDIFYVDAAATMGYASEAVKSGQFGSDHGSAGNVKQVFVHMGVHQTGAAQLQGVIRENRKRLPDRFAFFVQGDPACDALRDACVAFQKKASQGGHLREQERAVGDAMVRLIEACPARAGVMVISTPDLAGFMPGRLGVRRIYPHLGRIARLIRDALPGKAVTFIFYTREPGDWVRAVYNQAVRMHAVSDSFERFRQDLDGEIDIARHLDQVRETVAPAEVIELSFEAERASDHGLAHGFLTRVGIGAEALAGLKGDIEILETLDLDLLCVMREMNRLRNTNNMLSESGLREIRKALTDIQIRRKAGDLQL